MKTTYNVIRRLTREHFSGPFESETEVSVWLKLQSNVDHLMLRACIEFDIDVKDSKDMEKMIKHYEKYANLEKIK